MESRIELRRKDFKKAFDDPVRRRETAQVAIRKQNREGQLAKKRMHAANSGLGDVPQLREPEVNSDDLPYAVELLNSTNLEHVFKGVQLIRKMLSVESGPPIQKVIEAGVVPRFVQLLDLDERPDIQFEDAWALTNIASGSQMQTRTVLDANAVPKFIRLMKSPSDDVRDQAIWALSNIAGDSPQFRDIVIEAGALQPLLEILEAFEVTSGKTTSAGLVILGHATWALSNFCRGKPPPDFDQICQALPTLRKLLRSVNEEILTDACWAISYLSDASNEKDDRFINAIIRTGLCQSLVDLLGHSQPVVQTPALRAVGNIVTGDDNQTQAMIGYGCLPRLKTLLDSPKQEIQKEACWTISNITAGNPAQIEDVINHGIIPELVRLLTYSPSGSVKREAAWAISNAASGGNPRQVTALVEAKCLKPLVDLLEVQDHRIMKIALDAIDNILKVGKMRQSEEGLPENPHATLLEEAGAFPILEKLQHMAKMEDVQKAAVAIMMDYLDLELDEEVAVPPRNI